MNNFKNSEEEEKKYRFYWCFQCIRLLAKWIYSKNVFDMITESELIRKKCFLIIITKWLMQVYTTIFRERENEKNHTFSNLNDGLAWAHAIFHIVMLCWANRQFKIVQYIQHSRSVVSIHGYNLFQEMHLRNIRSTYWKCKGQTFS